VFTQRTSLAIRELLLWVKMQFVAVMQHIFCTCKARQWIRFAKKAIFGVFALRGA
jgi:hypothetical protein